MRSHRCSYRHESFFIGYLGRPFSAFADNNLHDDTGQCWMEGEHVGNFGTEKEPEHFCIFHAPDDKEPPSGFSKDERQALQPSVLKELLSKWNEVNEKFEKKERLIFLLPGMQCFEANLHGFIFSSNVNFDNAEFSGDARFDNATFSGNAWFINARFSGDAQFDKARFNSHASFSNARFSGNASFYKARFSGNAWFEDATFSGIASFNDATFSDYVSFDDATFSGDARFDDATFNSSAWFNAVEFNGRAYFNNTSFKNSLLLQSNSFKKGCWFTKNKFKDFQYIVHQGEKIRFNGCSGTFTFADQDCAKLSFLNMDLSSADFLGADIKETRFEACRWGKPENSHYSIVHHHKRILGRYKDSRGSNDEEVKKNAEDGITKLRSLYLQLKKNMEENHYYRRAGEFHYREMEIREMMEKSTLDKPMLWLYRRLADYGESWGKLLICLLLSFMICAGVIYIQESLVVDGSLTLWESLVTVVKAVVPSVFRKGADFSYLHWVSKGIIMFETVMALLLAALFAMAVRRRFRR